MRVKPPSYSARRMRASGAAAPLPGPAVGKYTGTTLRSFLLYSDAFI